MEKLRLVGAVICWVFAAASTVAEAVDGQWGQWQTGKCSVTCGEGLRPRFRNCDNPPPSGGGLKCVGVALQHDVCRMPPCPIDGGWNDWSAWSSCSGSCGVGHYRRRTRSCKAPSPQNGGQICEGLSEQTEPCNDELVQPCPVNGGWSGWYPFLPCPSDIGDVCRNPNKHQQVRQRFCTSPSPQYGGDDCEGSEFDYTPCFELYNCASGGQWSEWQHGSCSVTCGIGLEKLTRSCLDLAVGRNCSGPSELVQECNLEPCRVDGGWSSWHESRSCVVAQADDPCAGDGPADNDVRVLERSCDNPTPVAGGAPCDGESMRIEKCREVYGCPAPTTLTWLSTTFFPASWSSWQLDGPCGVTCGSGLQRRRRHCLSTTSECEGPSEEVITCTLPACPTMTTPYDNTKGVYMITVDDFAKQSTGSGGAAGVFANGFSPWTEWSSCDAASCHQTRWRICQTKRGGCYGNDIEKRTCSNPADACSAAALSASASSSASSLSSPRFFFPRHQSPPLGSFFSSVLLTTVIFKLLTVALIVLASVSSAMMIIC